MQSPGYKMLRPVMKVHKLNRYCVGAGLAGIALEFHLNLVSRQSRPLPASIIHRRKGRN
jgi:hypothetical protein